jgi:hypothetical protein
MYVKMKEAAIKELRTSSSPAKLNLLLTKDYFPSELLKTDYWEWESSSSPTP